MKTTDFAMIFVAIVLPIIIIVYVDISLLLKKEEQTLYYKNIIDSAIADATYAMKNVEGQDPDNDYGYSGLSEKRVTVNANIAIDTFFDSLYDNFEIKGDDTLENYLREHIPGIAIIDYNGIYVYSLDEYENASGSYIDHVLKPKRYFTYVYGIGETSRKLITGEEIEKTYKMGNSSIEYFTVLFTMDDMIGLVDNETGVISWFYLEDSNNNVKLYQSGNVMYHELAEDIIRHLKLQRTKTISEIVSKEMSYAVNSHNLYSESDYQFTFPDIAISDWQEMINNVGIIALIQGINLGNVKLDYVAHGISALKVTDRIYVSEATVGLKYYHNTESCSVYLENRKTYTGYFMNKIDAATAGYYPCPACNP